MAGRVQNLTPWLKSMGGNPGGWPKEKAGNRVRVFGRDFLWNLWDEGEGA